MKLRKLTVLICMMALLGGLIAGCGGGESNSNETPNATQPAEQGSKEPAKQPVKLTMWGGVPAEAGPQAVVDAWNKDNPDIQVEYMRFVNDDDGNLKLDTALMAGQDADLYVSYSVDRLQKRISAGVALDLAAFNDYNIDEKMGSDSAKWKVDDKYYGMPTKKNVTFIALNKDALDAANLPVPTDWTWDQAREYAAKLKTETRYGLIQHLEPFIDPMDSVLVKFGYTKEDGTSNLDHPLIQKWLETMKALMKEDKSTPPLGEQLTTKMPVESVFLKGEAAMLNIGEWLLRSSNNTKEFPRDFKIAFAPIPRLAENKEDFITNGGLGDFISINAKSPNKEAAWKFLKWYADGGMAPLAAGGRLPASKDADSDAALKSMVAGMEDTYDMESLERVLFENNTPSYVRSLPKQVIDIRREEYEKFFLDAQSLEDTVKNMVKRHDEFLKQNK